MLADAVKFREGQRAVFVLLIAVFLSGGTMLAADTEFYVAPDGRDINPGSRSRPFATLEAARDAIRGLSASAGLPADGVTVWIRGGTYLRDRSFELTERDSGRSNAPIVYRAASNEFVRLLGGRTLTNFQPVRDAAVLARLDPNARAHVVQTDLRAIGLSDYGQLRSRGFGRPIHSAHLELFYRGGPMTLARWPNEGRWERIAGFPDSGSQGDEHGGKIGELSGGFIYAGDRPHRWAASDDIWVHGYWAWDWANSYERVGSIELDQRLMKTVPPFGLYGFRKGQRFYFLNVLEELDEPGEWFLDRHTGLLYFWPPDSTSGSHQGPLSGEVTISVLEAPVIVLRDVANVAIRGLTLEAARGHGISIRNGTNDLIAGCTLRLLGNYGVWVEGGHHNGVRSCDIEDTGDGGVQLSGGDRQTLSAADHFVENCRFQRQGRWSKCYVPAVLMSGVGHRVTHNLIQDHPHCAILFGGNEHRIEFNEIHHVALETGDVGAIYSGRDWTFRGNHIRYNFIHHTGGVGMGSMGVYMDDCVSGTEIYGNIFFKVSRAAFLGGGRDHQVENNVFVDCHPAVQLDGRGLDKSPVWHGMVYDYMQRQLTNVPKSLYQERYPGLAQVARCYESSTNGIPPAGNIVARNICAGGEWLNVGWHATRGMLDLRANWVGSDPGFVDPDKMNFELRPDSLAWQTGFERIPVAEIGVHDDEFRIHGIAEASRGQPSPP
jgi:hypothetical protein